MKHLLTKIDNYIQNDFIEQDDLQEDMLSILSLIDFDNLTEEQIEKIDEIIDGYFEDDIINEKIERVVRGGKKVTKKVCPKGKKLSGGKCVKMKSSEKRKRSKASKKGAKKKKGQKSAIARKRKKSMKKR